ncbi:MAG: family intrarane metalloprotease [Chitinophagaceae bacterium]|nr:family intrarane metalloprotease [Chitinophagaceae bacterium]
MKKIFNYLKDFIKKDFNVGFYLYTVCFLVLFIYLNYSYDLENKWVNGSGINSWKDYFYYFSFYSFAYYAIAIPKALVFKENYLKQSAFWIKSSVFLLLLSIDGAFYHHTDYIFGHQQLDYEQKLFLNKIVTNAYPSLVYFIPLLMIKYLYDRREKGLYGLAIEGFDYKIYLVFLLVMAPLIFWASFQPDFIETYPEFKPWRMREVFGLSAWQMSGMFEVLYLFDFITVELLFRGALIIGLSSVMGIHVILPMVVTYAFLHFGKPMAETIGSIFGGYILGVIALYSRSILGGWAIHMGVACLMEVMALLQYYVIKGH